MTKVDEDDGPCKFSAHLQVPPQGKRLSVTISRSKRSARQDKATQTVFRESEAQTVPWYPDVVFRSRRTGARVTQDWLPPGEGPFDMVDAILMERARQRRAWEETLPRSPSKASVAIRLACVSSIEANETRFREASLNRQAEERLELSRRGLAQARERALSELRLRLENMKRKRRGENADVVEQWRQQMKRNVRKLRISHLRMTGRIGREEVPRYEAPEDAPERGRRVSHLIPEEVGFSRYLAEFKGIEMLERRIFASSRHLRLMLRGPEGRKECLGLPRICSRTLRNAEKEFEKLSGGEEEGDPAGRGSELRLRQRMWHGGKSESEVRESEARNETYQACLLIGKIIKGRAIQSRVLSAVVECTRQLGRGEKGSEQDHHQQRQ